MKVYVDEIPDTCQECIFHKYTEQLFPHRCCAISSKGYPKTEINDSCPLVLLPNL